MQLIVENFKQCSLQPHTRSPLEYLYLLFRMRCYIKRPSFICLPLTIPLPISVVYHVVKSASQVHSRPLITAILTIGSHVVHQFNQAHDLNLQHGIFCYLYNTENKKITDKYRILIKIFW